MSACAPGERDASASPTPRTTSAPPETEGAEGEPPPLGDGRNFGYIRAFDASERTLTFDLAELLTGRRANAAAVEDGVIQPGESVDSGYYIRNRNSRLRTLPYVEDLQIRLVNWPNCCDNPIDGTIEDFAAAFGPGGKSDLYRGPDTPYVVVVEGGAVVRIKEQYLP